MSDWNNQIIEEFRANGGNVSGPFEGAPMVLVHHRGAKTGTERVTPLMYYGEEDRIYIFASKAGAPDNPDWYHNLRANPETTIEIGDDAGIDVRVAEVTGTERDRVFEAQVGAYPQFGEYAEKTDRTIPVLAIDRI